MIEKKMVKFMAGIVCVCLMSGCVALGTGKNHAGPGKASGITEKEPPKPPLYYEFKDVLIPGEYTQNRKYTAVTETDGMPTGFISFYGAVEAGSTANFFTVKMPEDGWAPVTVVKSPFATVLVFSKAGRCCVINISETDFTTDLRIGIAPEIKKKDAEPAAPAAATPPDQDVILEPSGVIEE